MTTAEIILQKIVKTIRKILKSIRKKHHNQAHRNLVKNWKVRFIQDLKI